MLGNIFTVLLMTVIFVGIQWVGVYQIALKAKVKPHIIHFVGMLGLWLICIILTLAGMVPFADTEQSSVALLAAVITTAGTGVTWWLATR